MTSTQVLASVPCFIFTNRARPAETVGTVPPGSGCPIKRIDSKFIHQFLNRKSLRTAAFGARTSSVAW